MMGLEEHLSVCFGKIASSMARRHRRICREWARPVKTMLSADASKNDRRAVFDERMGAGGRQELSKIPFFVRGKARRNTERFAQERGLATITIETFVRCQSAFRPLTRRRSALSLLRWTAIWLARRAERARRCAANCRVSNWTCTRRTSGAAILRRWRAASPISPAAISSIATMLFLEDHIRAVLPALIARHENCDALLCGMSAGEVVKLTRLGKFRMSEEAVGAIGWLKRLRGKRSGAGASGQGQMKMLRQLPRLLRFVPGKAQDVRAYFLSLQYWLAGSEDNLPISSAC